MGGMSNDYDLKKVEIKNGDTETPFIAMNPSHAAGLILSDVAITMLTIRAFGPDFRLRHMAEATGSGETAVPQLVIDFPISSDGIAADTLVIPADLWIDIPEILMKSPRIKFTFADPGEDVTLYICTKE